MKIYVFDDECAEAYLILLAEDEASARKLLEKRCTGDDPSAYKLVGETLVTGPLSVAVVGYGNSDHDIVGIG